MSRGHLVTFNRLADFTLDFYTILFHPLCFSFEIHQIATAFIRGKTVVTLRLNFLRFNPILPPATIPTFPSNLARQTSISMFRKLQNDFPQTFIVVSRTY
jgi:hypothetical protein